MKFITVARMGKGRRGRRKRKIFGNNGGQVSLRLWDTYHLGSWDDYSAHTEAGSSDSER